MRIIFFGTPLFAACNLEYIIDKCYKVVAVVTPPDKKKGRGKRIQQSAVKEMALKNNILVLQPTNLKSEKFIKKIKSLNAELFLVVAFRFLPEIVWKIPNKGTINLHTSMLPNYRGAAPINRVLINGEKETGLSVFYINNKIDCGEIIVQERLKIENHTTAGQLHNLLIIKGNKLITKTLDLISEKKAISSSQNYTKDNKKAEKLQKEEFKIDWTKTALEIHNLVRGLSPYIEHNLILKDISICPSAWFILESETGIQKRIKIFRTEIIKTSSNKLLKIETDNKTFLHVKTKKNTISILNLQVEGKKHMTIIEYFNGNKITKNHKIL